MTYDNTNTGALFKNNRRETDKQPTHTGTINVGGVEYWLSAWVRESKDGNRFFSLAVKPKEQRRAEPTEKSGRARPGSMKDEMDDFVPF